MLNVPKVQIIFLPREQLPATLPAAQQCLSFGHPLWGRTQSGKWNEWQHAISKSLNNESAQSCFPKFLWGTIKQHAPGHLLKAKRGSKQDRGSQRDVNLKRSTMGNQGMLLNHYWSRKNLVSYASCTSSASIMSQLWSFNAYDISLTGTLRESTALQGKPMGIFLGQAFIKASLRPRCKSCSEVH